MTEGSAWAAGFFDGEGSINILVTKQQKTGNRHHVLSCSVAQVDPRPLQYLQEQYGGAICFKPSQQEGWRPSYYWAVTSKAAENFLRDVRPWLRVKGEQADIALAFREIKGKRGGRHGYQQDIFDQRQILKTSLESSRYEH